MAHITTPTEATMTTRKKQGDIPTVASWDLAYHIADEHGYAPNALQEVRFETRGYLYSWAAIPGTMGHPRFTVIVRP